MRKICVVTTTRAEYGILKPLITSIQNDAQLQLQLVVTGTHLQERFGETYKEIEKDFYIADKVAMNLTDTTTQGLSIVMAELQTAMTKSLARLVPDIVIILGDRYEILSVATTAMMLQIPLAHIHGGEITQGAIDDNIRHAVTKLSHLHFTSTPQYTKRVIQLGEEPNRVFYVGSLSVQNIKKMQLLSKKDFEKSIQFTLAKKNLLITYHPQTLCSLTPQEQFQELLNALDTLEDTHLIFTKANADAGGEIINTMIDNYVKNNKQKAVAFASLGALRYFSAIKYVDAVVGNSSSGILEVPSFHKATINIGQRQQGRTAATSVLNAEIIKADILDKIEKAYNPEFLHSIKEMSNPYEKDGSAQNILKVLKNFPLENILVKKFYDVHVPSSQNVSL
jgi:GDP/UDP-N,N'-diacetylbacillosamine 2-epimerase (hydrolysing)